MTNAFPFSRAVATATAALCACLLAFASRAAAFTPSTKTGSEQTQLNLTTSSGAASHASSGGGASLVRTIVGLAIVIAVIWGLAWILKQVKAGKDPHVSSAGLASVAALTLGSGRTVHLVRAGSDYVLLGSTEQGLSPIHRYTEEEAREAGIFADGEPTVERSRLFTVASQLVVGAGRAVGNSSYAQRSGFADAGARSDRLALPRQAGHAGVFGEDEWGGPFPDQPAHSPVIGRRPDPMRAQARHAALGAGSGGLLERLRELTVRR